MKWKFCHEADLKLTEKKGSFFVDFSGLWIGQLDIESNILLSFYLQQIYVSIKLYFLRDMHVSLWPGSFGLFLHFLIKPERKKKILGKDLFFAG